MKIKQYVFGAVMAVAVAISCSPDPSLYPLPYDSRATGSYLRAYRVNSNVWDLNDTLNSAFTAVYESVDRSFGADLQEIRFYATHRSSGGLITDEVLVKTIDAATIAANFAKVPEPTYSDYLRSTPISVTYAETMTALRALKGVDPDGVNGVDLPQCTGIFPKTCPAVAFPYAAAGVGELQNNDRIVFRIAIMDNQGRLFTVANPQTTAAPYLGNPVEANITPNLTGGIFYTSPMLFNVTVVRMTNVYNANAYTGDYKMTQVARWQPDHSTAQHQAFPQAWIDEFVFGNSATDSTQTVTLALGDLPTERTFSCTYRGSTINLMINFENAATGLSAAAITTLNAPLNAPGQPAATVFGLGMPGATTGNLGTIFVPLVNTGVDCTSTREFYQVTPLGGTFAGSNVLPWGLPRNTVPNRGAYRVDQDGTVAGQSFLISLDDDADEYGRRNGYCTWYTRVLLHLQKL